MSTTMERRVSTKVVAAHLGVNPKTIARWSRAGKIPSTLTMGGHRRYLISEVKAAIARTHPGRL
jgi:excisionase family DNA binding protein